jgi:undecaprenyldiphospho-muramoylpentapeptide beta-N-acetylglucosaminyltransferase
VYPALAVVEAVKNSLTDLLWVGSQDGMEADLVKRQGIRFEAIPAAGVHGVGLKRLPHNLGQLARGVNASRRILREFKPDVLFFTGGYVAVPMAVAGRRTPTLLYVPDIEPGLALKALARFADRIAVTAEESRRFFPRSKRVAVSGYPTRFDLGQWERSAAIKYFNFTNDLPILLVTGGSKGARSINQAIRANRSALLDLAQVIHITGSLDWPEVEASLGELSTEQQARYHASAYLHEDMAAALSAANLVLSRAGASTLGEYPQLGLPAILVPYPYAWRYQKVNADYLVEQGAAVMVKDAELKDALIPTVRSLLGEAGKLDAMKQSMRRLSCPQAAQTIAGQLLKLAGKG